MPDLGTDRNLLRAVKNAAAKLNIPKANLHAFRRTAVLRYFEAGVDTLMISRRTGHSDLRTLNARYFPVATVHKIGALRKFEEYLKGGQNVDKSLHNTKAA